MLLTVEHDGPTHMKVLRCPNCSGTNDQAAAAAKRAIEQWEENPSKHADENTIQWLISRIPECGVAKAAAWEAIQLYHREAMTAAKVIYGRAGKMARIQQLRDRLAQRLRDIIDGKEST